MMQRCRVVVTGMGAVTPIGKNKNDFWNSLVNARGGIGRITKFDPSEYTSQIAGEVKDFDPGNLISSKDLRRMDSFVQYALVAAEEALKDAHIQLPDEDSSRMGCILGSGIGGLLVIENQHQVLIDKGPRRVSPFLIPMLIVNMASGQVAINYKLKGPNYAVVTACASSNHAIGDAFRVIQRGEADLMVTGGTESSITPLGVAGFCSLKALSIRNDDPDHASRPFDKERDGFVIAEGSGIVILESLEHAKKRKAEIIAELIGYGASCDAYHMTAPEPEGEGAVLAIKATLKDAQINPEDVDYINAHGTSTELNDKIETKAIKKVFKDYAKKLAISSTKSMTGHMLGAAGGAEFIACALAIKEGILPPTVNYKIPDPECDLDYIPNEARKKNINIVMSNGLGFGGHNAFLILKKFS